MDKLKLNNNGESWRETPTVQKLLLSFVDLEFKRNVHLKDAGANEYSEKCLHAIGALVSNNSAESFSANDFYNYCAPFDIPYEFKRDFFDRVTTMLIQNERCVETKGCYSESVYQLR